MNNYINTLFEKEHKEYMNVFMKGIKVQESYDKIRIVAKCCECSVYKKNEGIPQQEWKSECKEKGICKKVLETYLKLVENEKIKDDVKERYARNVFIFFSKDHPLLLRRKDKTTISWEEAFGLEYESLEKGLRNSLVALIEESGGRYRLLNQTTENDE